MAQFLSEAEITGVASEGAPAVKGVPAAQYLSEAQITGIDPIDTAARKGPSIVEAVGEAGNTLVKGTLAGADMFLGAPAAVVGWAQGVGGALRSVLTGESSRTTLTTLMEEELPTLTIPGTKLKMPLEVLKTPLQSIYKILAKEEPLDQSAITAIIDKAGVAGEKIGIPREATVKTIGGIMAFGGLAGLHGGIKAALKEPAAKSGGENRAGYTEAAPEEPPISPAEAPFRQELPTPPTVAERAATTKARAKDIRAAFKDTDTADHLQFKANETMESRSQALVNEAMKTGRTVDAPDWADVAKEASDISQKPGAFRTPEEMIKLREYNRRAFADQRGKIDPELLPWIIAGVTTGTVGGIAIYKYLKGLQDEKQLDEENKNPQIYDIPSNDPKEQGTMLADAMLGGALMAGAVKGVGDGVWTKGAVERLARPLALKLVNVPTDLPGVKATPGSPKEVWATKAITKHLNKHFGAETDPLNSVKIPMLGDEVTWGEIADKVVKSAKIPTRLEMLKKGEALKGEAIWDVESSGLGESSVARGADHVRHFNALQSYLSHVGDYLREFVPPEKLGQYDLTRAVKETAAQDVKQAKKMADAQAKGEGTVLYKQYPDGMKWVEVGKVPEGELPAGWKIEKRNTPSGPVWKAIKNGKEEASGSSPERAQELARLLTAEEALKNEGDVMGHCVGGYCEAVHSGESKIYSLRDKKGMSHVTVEVVNSDARPSGMSSPEVFYQQASKAFRDKFPIPKNYGVSGVDNATVMQDIKWHQSIYSSSEYKAWRKERPTDILQIKGKQNRAPVAQYLSYVQDFVRSGKWGEVGDLNNSGLSDLSRYNEPTRLAADRLFPGQKYLSREEIDKAIDNLNPREILDYEEGKIKDRTQRGSADPKTLAAIAAVGGGAAIGAAIDPEHRLRNALIGAGIGVAAVNIRPRAIADFIKRASETAPLVKIDAIANQTDYVREAARRATHQVTQRLITAVPDSLRREAIYDALRGKEVALSPVERAQTTAMREFFDKLGGKALGGGVIKDIIDNYITRIYGKDAKSLLSTKTLGPGMKLDSPFGKSRQFLTDEDAAAAGYKPITRDPAKIAEAYSESVTTALENKRVFEVLKNTKDDVSGLPLIMKEAAAPHDYAYMDTPQLRGWRVHPDIVGDMQMMSGKVNTPAIVNALEAVNSVQKRTTTSLSLFHAAALEHAMLGMMPLTKSPALFVKSLAQSLGPRGAAMVLGGIIGSQVSDEHGSLGMMAGAALGAWGGKVFNPKLFGEITALKELREGGVGDNIDALLKGGLKIAYERQGTGLHEMQTGFDEAVRSTTKFLDNTIPGAGKYSVGQYAKLMEDSSNFLWGRLQAMIKIEVGQSAAARLFRGIAKDEAAGGYKGTLDTPEKVWAAAASITNDAFGSLNYPRIVQEFQSRFGRDVASALLGPAGKLAGRLSLFAMDWTVSTTRAFLKAFGQQGVAAGVGAVLGSQVDPEHPGVGALLGGAAGYGAGKALGLQAPKGSGLKGLWRPTELADLHRQYLLRSAFIYSTIIDAVNYQLSGHHFWDNKDPTRLDNGDGTTTQVSKHFMEPFHWLLTPRQQLMNKTSFLVKETASQLEDKEYWSARGAPRLGKTPLDQPIALGTRAAHAAKAFSPISVQQSWEATGNKGLAGMLGSPILGKTYEERAAAKTASKALKRTPEYREAKRLRDLQKRIDKRTGR
jgi:hypothetical protein